MTASGPRPIQEILDPGERLEAMLAELAVAGAHARRGGDANAARVFAELHRRIDGVVTGIKAKLAAEQARAQLAAQVDALVDSVPALAAQAAALKTATRADDVGKMGEGLRAIAEWIGMPSETAGKPLAELVARVRAITGVPADHDDAAATAARTAAIESAARAQVETIFADLGIPLPQ